MHGYSRSFTFWFAATELDACGFVVDFSSLRPLEKRLRDQFDHTFLVNDDDPLLEINKEDPNDISEDELSSSFENSGRT